MKLLNQQLIPSFCQEVESFQKRAELCQLMQLIMTDVVLDVLLPEHGLFHVGRVLYGTSACGGV